MNKDHKYYLELAIDEAQIGIDNNSGGPFGAVIVKDGIIISKAHNEVTSTNDPTAHAEVLAIRKACKTLNSFQLNDCILYASCEPCPMCLGAIYWARPKQVFYALNRNDAQRIGFDDQFIYDEINLSNHNRHIEFIELNVNSAKDLFNNWKIKNDKINY